MRIQQTSCPRAAMKTTGTAMEAIYRWERSISAGRDQFHLVRDFFSGTRRWGINGPKKRNGDGDGSHPYLQ